jgi:hypothetical protein
VLPPGPSSKVSATSAVPVALTVPNGPPCTNVDGPAVAGGPEALFDGGAAGDADGEVGRSRIKLGAGIITLPPPCPEAMAAADGEP